MIRDIKDFEGLYQITSDGKVLSLYTNRYLKPKINKDGYESVPLFKDKKSHYKLIHRLVAMSYLEKPEGCDIVNHLDMNKRNNDVSNLEWTTVQGNTCTIKGIEFNSQVEASRYFNVNIKTIYNWLKRGGDSFVHL